MGVDPLEELISQERMEAIIKLLTRSELVVALLRAEELSDGEVAEFLGISPMAVHRRMVRAKRRILREFPELTVALRGRRKGRGARGRRREEGIE